MYLLEAFAKQLWELDPQSIMASGYLTRGDQELRVISTGIAVLSAVGLGEFLHEFP